MVEWTTPPLGISNYGQYSQPPRAPAPAPSSEWIKYETDQGVPYWYSTRTQQTQWENPGV